MYSTVKLAKFQVLLSGQLTTANHARPVGLFFLGIRAPDPVDPWSTP